MWWSVGCRDSFCVSAGPPKCTDTFEGPTKGPTSPTWREIVLKKAGIVVAASAVSVLAISPLAFAGGKDDDRDRDRGGRDKGDSTQVNQIDNERTNNQNG